MFNKNDNMANDRIIYKGKPNLIFGCKKAIFGVILLFIVLSIASPIIQFIGQMQVYLISHVKLALTHYAAIVIFLIILLIVIYIIWQLIGWYSKEYILTDSRIVVKSGVLFSRKNYMPYNAIQDINTSQSIFARLVNVGSISVFSAYDSNQMELANISNPSEVEEIIFSKIMQPRGFDNNYIRQNRNPDYELNDDEYYDDYDYITPIRHDEQYATREYDYYPENLNYDETTKNHYEYEPYDSMSLERNIDKAINNFDSSNDFDNQSYYDEVRGNYSYSDDDYYDDNQTELYYNDADSQDLETDEDNTYQEDESREKVIKRHFDKFKK